MKILFNILSLITFICPITITSQTIVGTDDYITNFDKNRCYRGKNYDHYINPGNYECKCKWEKITLEDVSVLCPQGRGMYLILEDNFDGTELNPAYWKKGLTWGRYYNDQIFVVTDDNIVVNNGTLKLTAKPTYTNYEAIDFYYTGGIISSELGFGYGKFEARIKMCSNPKSINSAFWFYTGCHNEIDVYETFDDQSSNSNNINVESKNRKILTSVYSSYDHNCNAGTANRCHRDYNTLFNSNDPLSNWHTYVMYWTPTKIYITIDGVDAGPGFSAYYQNSISGDLNANRYYEKDNVFCYSLQNNHYFEDGKKYKKLVSFPREENYTFRMMLQQAVRNIKNTNNPDLQDSQTMEVDYVKVWQLGGCQDLITMCGDFIVNNADLADNSSVGQIINFSPSNCGWHLINNNFANQISKSYISSASTEINIYAGFEVDNGCDFTAQIKPCEPSPANHFKIPVVLDTTNNIVDVSETQNLESGAENNYLNIRLFPNPVIDKMVLETPTSEGTYEIFNEIGESILKGDIKFQSTSIQLTSFASGVYLIKYSNDNNSLTCTKKFIKNAD